MPRVDVSVARRLFKALHAAIKGGMVRACHDLSEGGLAVAAAEMAFAGQLGADVYLDRVPAQIDAGENANPILLYSESNSRLLCEVPPPARESFEALLAGLPHALIGQVVESKRLRVVTAAGATAVIEASLDTLEAAWKAPLDW